MINVDDRILIEVDASEMWLLLHITRRLGKKMYCWPSNDTLMKDTGFKIDKLREVKKSLVEKRLISIEIKDGTSNIYRIETDKLGVFIAADRLNAPPSEKPTGPPRKNQLPTPSEKPTDKYYKSEVLKSNCKAYALCVEFWLKEFHIGWSFRPVSGKALKSLIKQIQNLLAAIGRENGDEAVASFFIAMCQHLPQYYKQKDLQVLDMKFNEIIEEIKKSKNGNFTNTRPESKFRN